VWEKYLFLLFLFIFLSGEEKTQQKKNKGIQADLRNISGDKVF